MICERVRKTDIRRLGRHLPGTILIRGVPVQVVSTPCPPRRQAVLAPLPPLRTALRDPLPVLVPDLHERALYLGTGQPARPETAEGHAVA